MENTTQAHAGESWNIRHRHIWNIRHRNMQESHTTQAHAGESWNIRHRHMQVSHGTCIAGTPHRARYYTHAHDTCMTISRLVCVYVGGGAFRDPPSLLRQSMPPNTPPQTTHDKHLTTG